MQQRLQNTTKDKPMQSEAVISFFSGCGGFDLGFASAGFSIKLALDVDPMATKSYNHNRGGTICHVADLADTDPTAIVELYRRECGSVLPRGVIGGAPCQTFSSGNVHFNGDDARHTLPRRYACILRILNEEYDLDFFVFENVKGITSPKHRKEYTTIKRLFSRAGFKLFEGELDAVHFGVAQHRCRVFIVGFNKVKYPNIKFAFPEAETVVPLTIISLAPPRMMKGRVGGGRRRLETAIYFGALEPDPNVACHGRLAPRIASIRAHVKRAVGDSHRLQANSP